jgi:pimeloyl-ACP methyl ester carboxylesterase
VDREPIALPIERAAAEPRAPKPIRKDEIEIAEQGLLIESWLPERRSRRRPLVLVHGELGGSWVWHRFQEYFAGRGWEAHAVNLRGHYWSDTCDLEGAGFDDYVDDVAVARRRIGDSVVLVGHGLGALLTLRVASIAPPAGLVLIAPALPAAIHETALPHELRAVPDLFRRDLLGWQGLPEQIRRENPDLSIADVLRVQHMMGAESGAARRDMLVGVDVDPEPLEGVPMLVIGGGLDRAYPSEDAERLADWLGAEFEPFGAHSHYGLVAGDDTHEQVAMAVRSFLEAHRL